MEDNTAYVPVLQGSITEESLNLVISEKHLGSLTTNARQLKEFVLSILPRYDIANYDSNNIEQAKKDKALLNKAAKALNSKRIEIEKEFMLPFSEFKDTVSETVRLIKECSDRIDTVVKESEQREKDRKLAGIKSYFDKCNPDGFIDFNKIFMPAWLNKTTSMKSACQDIYSRVCAIRNDMETIATYGEDKEVLLAYYKGTLDLNGTIQYANRLKSLREKAAKEALNKHVETQAAGQNERKPAMGNPIPDAAQEQLPKDNGQLYTRMFIVRDCTAAQLNGLALFMEGRGIDYDKIETDDVPMCKTIVRETAKALEHAVGLLDKAAPGDAVARNRKRLDRILLAKWNRKLSEME